MAMSTDVFNAAIFIIQLVEFALMLIQIANKAMD
jgi:hypothetical protein